MHPGAPSLNHCMRLNQEVEIFRCVADSQTPHQEILYRCEGVEVCGKVAVLQLPDMQ